MACCNWGVITSCGASFWESLISMAIPVSRLRYRLNPSPR